MQDVVDDWLRQNNTNKPLVFNDTHTYTQYGEEPKVYDITHIPYGVKKLHIKCCINLHVPIPETVIELVYDDNDGPLPKLPDGLRRLYCQLGCTISLPEHLPSNLHTLDISATISNFPSKLPDGLKKLVIRYNTIKLPTLPNGLKHLCCKMCYDPLPEHLPPKLVYLECTDAHIDRLPELPDTLKVLICSRNNIRVLPPLPVSLQLVLCRDNLLSYVGH